MRHRPARFATGPSSLRVVLKPGNRVGLKQEIVHTIRKTDQFALVWVATLTRGEKHSEYLTEFDCNRGTYRQVALRVLNAEHQVISSDAIYRQWLDVPGTSQVIGLVCREPQRPEPFMQR
jgi:hypothetical protein